MRGIGDELRRMMESIIESEVQGRDLSEDEFKEVVNSASRMLRDEIYRLFMSNERRQVHQLRKQGRAFEDRNYEKWGIGFDALNLLRQVSLEAGAEFKRAFLKHPQFETDPLLGVLMRLHANACRGMGEVIELLESGYPDAALGRWRTLFEMAVTALLLRKLGKEAAIDYIKYGRIQAIDGMLAYQETAEAMGREPYKEAELRAAVEYQDALFADCGEGFKSRNGWARKYVGSSKLSKLAEEVGMKKWLHDYKLASQNIHVDFREMGSLLGMSDAQRDMLLAGQSNSGMTEPAHSAAIALSQVTAAFVTCYADDEDCPIDYTHSSVFVGMIDLLVEEIGERFVRCFDEAQSRHRWETEPRTGCLGVGHPRRWIRAMRAVKSTPPDSLDER